MKLNKKTKLIFSALLISSLVSLTAIHMIDNHVAEHIQYEHQDLNKGNDKITAKFNFCKELITNVFHLID